MITSERQKGSTPRGGAYSEIFYFDDAWQPTDRSAATKCVIRECAEDGSLICETWGVCGTKL